MNVVFKNCVCEILVAWEVNKNTEHSVKTSIKLFKGHSIKIAPKCITIKNRTISLKKLCFEINIAHGEFLY